MSWRDFQYEDEDDALSKAISRSIETYEQEQARKTQGLTLSEENSQTFRLARPILRVSMRRWRDYQSDDLSEDEALRKAIFLSIETYEQVKESRVQGLASFVGKSKPFNLVRGNSRLSSSRTATYTTASECQHNEESTSSSRSFGTPSITRYKNKTSSRKYNNLLSETCTSPKRENTLGKPPDGPLKARRSQETPGGTNSLGLNYGTKPVQSKKDMDFLSRKKANLQRKETSSKPQNVAIKCRKDWASGQRNSALNVPPIAQVKAIPLCLPNNVSWDPATGEIHKTEEKRYSLLPVPVAIEILKAIKEPVCVVAIAGPYREGKSYILSEVFGETDVFPIGHDMDAKTMGLWMWVVRQKFKDSRGQHFRVILLDSEGTNASTAGSQNDTQIFTLTVLLASVLIYNSKGVPKRNDFNDLNLIAKLSQRIRIRSKGGCDDQDLFRNTFPFFIWLLRDVSQKLPSDCRDLNQFFLTRVFKESAITLGDEIGPQIVAESISKFFSGFEAFALPSPSSDDDVMQDISNHRDKLNPKFLEGVERFKTLLKLKLAPKSSITSGERITGEALGALVQLYTEAINDPDAIPNVESAWETYVRTKCTEAEEEALKIYDQVMARLMSTRLPCENEEILPCENEEILKNHEIAQRKSMETFERETVELASTSIDRKLNELMASTEEKMKTWKTKNASGTRRSCENLLRSLQALYLDPVLKRVRSQNGNSVRYTDITNGWSTINNEFHRQAIGARDIKAEVFFKFNQQLEEEITKYQEVLCTMQDYEEDLARQKIAAAYQEKEKIRLQEDLAQLGKREEALERKIAMLERRQREELESMREQAKTEKQSLNRNIEMVREAGIKRQSQFQQQVNAATARERQANQDLQKLKRACYNERQKALDQKRTIDKEMESVAQESRNIQRKIKSQIESLAERERKHNDSLRSFKQQIEKNRREKASLRNKRESLQAQLDEVNNAGFFTKIWRIIF